MEKMASLYREHIATLLQRTRDILAREKLDSLLIHSGEPIRIFLDDRDYPFKSNVHFKAWVPVTDVPHCWLWTDGVNKPKLWFYSPVDYWHSVEALPSSYWTNEVEVIHLKNAGDIASMLASQDKTRTAYIGPNTDRAAALGISSNHINPKAVLDFFAFHRSYKTDYELAWRLTGILPHMRLFYPA